MVNQRRRGKSVVFDSLPSLVTTAEEDLYSLSRDAGSFADRVSREALREIVMVLIGLALVVWLFFGQSGTHDGAASGLSMGSRQVLMSDSVYIVPAHLGSASNARDSVRKAPGDKQGMMTPDSSGSKRASGAIYQYDGSESPELVVVTVVDDTKHPREYIDKIIENRLEYAQRHRFGLLIKYVSDFSKFVDVSYNHQNTWSRVALAMEAPVSFPQAEWFWFLADDAIIMQPEFNVLSELLADSEAIESHLQRQVPVMRYSNTHIRTYATNRPQDIQYIFSRDGSGVGSTSFFFRNTPQARVLLQLWAEPLYRSFQRFDSESDALGHLLQWHSQFLLRTGVYDTHLMGSLAVLNGVAEDIRDEVVYRQDDFVAVVSCDYATEGCKREFHRRWNERKRVPLTTGIFDGANGADGAAAGAGAGAGAGGAGAAAAGAAGAAGDAKGGGAAMQNQLQMQAQEKTQEKAEKQAAEAEALKNPQP